MAKAKPKKPGAPKKTPAKRAVAAAKAKAPEIKHDDLPAPAVIPQGEVETHVHDADQGEGATTTPVLEAAPDATATAPAPAAPVNAEILAKGKKVEGSATDSEIRELFAKLKAALNATESSHKQTRPLRWAVKTLELAEEAAERHLNQL